MAVLLETSLGDIAIDLYPDEAPKECLNFIKLCKIKYYNYCAFHRVLKNFIAQTGDPTATGRGGESVWGKIDQFKSKNKENTLRYYPKPETNRLKHKKYGLISMTNNGGDMHGSQFFLTLGENLDSLDGRHSVFGEIAEESYDVLRSINDAYCDDNGRPYQDIRIRHTIILDDPFEDMPGLDRLIPEKSPEPTEEQLKTVRIADDEALNDNEGMTVEEVEQLQRQKVAKAQATILEMVGDIADADMAPPENVLFVCQLNAITTAEDLELIFSRFGKIVSCHIVLDWKTQDSLQYGFVEFENTKDAEEAYFKMDNVLIDDRRIHVNFCQSVSKANYFFPKRYSKGGKETDKLELKDKKKKDGYEMVFDDDNGPGYKAKQRSRDEFRRRSRSPRRDRDRRDDRDRHRDRERSRDKGRERHRDRDRRDKDRSRDRDRDRR
eukprot:m.333114 g.333114  ORF g.333114 m.333114 type:complete len:437 (-) comp17072_c0_seq1:45-1355(-)